MSSSMLTAVLALAVLAEVSSAPSPAPESPLQPLPASSLFTLQESAEPALVWAQYERSLLSRERVTPWLLYFASDCQVHQEDEDDEEERDPELQTSCVQHEKLVQAAAELVAESLAPVKYPVVRMAPQEWPQMQHFHLVTSTPSLLWLPGRSSGRFQRYPHVETNFLDLGVNGSLFTTRFGEGQDDAELGTSLEATEEAVAEEIAAFVRRCQERSGYVTRNSRGRLTVTVPTSRGPDGDAFSWLELLPVLGVLAFLAVVVNENRVFVLSVVRTRLFWFVLCLGVIYVALSGLFYSIIHRSPWYYFGRQHGFVFVYPSSRRQFVLEGLVNGTWSFWMSLAAMSISDVTSKLRSRLAREEIIRWSLLVVAISYMAIYFTFLMKYRWLA